MRGGCWVAVAALAGLLAACGTSAASAAEQQAYLGQVHAQLPAIASLRTDTSLVRLGTAACDGLSSGAGFAAVAAQLQSANPTLASEAVGTLVTAAADQLCPAQRSRVP